MPIFFAFVGTLFIVSGVRGTTSQLTTLLKADFTGTPNYLEWSIAIVIIGAIGYFKELSTISRAFLVLVLVALFLSEHGGFAQQFFSAFTQGTESAPLTSQTPVSINPAPSTTNIPPANALPGLPDIPSIASASSLENFL